MSGEFAWPPKMSPARVASLGFLAAAAFHEGNRYTRSVVRRVPLAAAEMLAESTRRGLAKRVEVVRDRMLARTAVRWDVLPWDSPNVPRVARISIKRLGAHSPRWRGGRQATVFAFTTGVSLSWTRESRGIRKRRVKRNYVMLLDCPFCGSDACASATKPFKCDRCGTTLHGDPDLAAKCERYLTGSTLPPTDRMRKTAAVSLPRELA